MIDLKEVEIIAKWVREQQAESPKSMDLIFGGKEETLAQALEALPGLVETLEKCKAYIEPQVEHIAEATSLANDTMPPGYGYTMPDIPAYSAVLEALELFTTKDFVCQGCKHELESKMSMRTPGYCYMCDPNITIAELLSDEPLKSNNNAVSENPWQPCGEGENICNCKSPAECGYKNPRWNELIENPTT